MFDVYYIGKNDNLKNELPLAKSIKKESDVNPKTKMYWLVEEHVEVTDTSVFEYRPSQYDAQYEHVWKWRESDYGGVKLIPSNGKIDGVKEVDLVVCKRKFDIFYYVLKQTRHMMIGVFPLHHRDVTAHTIEIQ